MTEQGGGLGERDPQCGGLGVSQPLADGLTAGSRSPSLAPWEGGSTFNCESGNHHRCGGYIHPLASGNTDLCPCRCHEHGRVPIQAGDTIKVYNERVAAYADARAAREACAC